MENDTICCVSKEFLFKLTHRNIFLLVKVTRAFRPRAQKSAPSLCQTRLVLRPTELYFRHAIIQILPDICRYILSNIHKFNSPDRLTYIRFFCIVLLFFLADSIGKRSHWGFDPSPYPSITTHASVPAYTQSQGLSVTGKFFRSE